MPTYKQEKVVGGGYKVVDVETGRVLALKTSDPSKFIRAAKANDLKERRGVMVEHTTKAAGTKLLASLKKKK